MTEHESKSISYLRAIATIFIFLCHTVGFAENSIIAASAMFFNVGVYIFLFISGYLYAEKRVSENYKFSKWILTRYIRITLPVLIYMSVVVLINYFHGHTTGIMNIISLIFNLEIFLPSIWGLHHLWFLSVIMICYILLYFVDYARLNFKCCVNIWSIIFGIANIGLLLFIMVQNNNAITYSINIITFFVGYWIGNNKKILKRINCGGYCLVAFIAILIRLFSWYFWDGTSSYYFISGYTHMFLSIAIVALVLCSEQILKKLSACFLHKVIMEIEKVSFCFYIVHYLFISGISPLISVTNVLAVNIVIIFIISLVVSHVLFWICERITGIIADIINLK